MSGFRFARRARQDVREIVAYIAADNRSAAEHLKQQLYDAVRRLVEHPELGRPRTDLTDARVNFWRVGSYWIVYLPSTDPLYVLRVLHSARDIRGVLGE
jgi:plasmid stabilization system protein ParE